MTRKGTKHLPMAPMLHMKLTTFGATAEDEASLLEMIWRDIAAMRPTKRQTAALPRLVAKLGRFASGEDVSAVPSAIAAPLSRESWIRLTPNIRRALIARRKLAEMQERIK